jgi:hypothetical protein
MHDPNGVFLDHVGMITPQLKELFSATWLGIPPGTLARQRERVRNLERDSFFKLAYPPVDAPVGDQFRAFYSLVADACPPEQVLQLAYVDRVSFALESPHRAAFAEDMRLDLAGQVPLIYHRSNAAWDTHPRTYRELEGMATRAGELLFGRVLDYCWCQMAIQAGQLQGVLPKIHSRGISMVAEIVLQVQGQARTKDVDWLSWEDPFILGRDPVQLMQERETSPAEISKRLSYVGPILELLGEYGRSNF